MSGAIAALYEAEGTDAGLLTAALRVEEVAALAYAAAAEGPLAGEERAQALRFAEHERHHAAAFETMLFALTVPVREHATPADVEELVPGLADDPLKALLELESAAIAGHQVMARRLAELDALRTVAAVMAGAAQHLVVIRRELGDATLTLAFESGG